MKPEKRNIKVQHAKVSGVKLSHRMRKLWLCCKIQKWDFYSWNSHKNITVAYNFSSRFSNSTYAGIFSHLCAAKNHSCGLSPEKSPFFYFSVITRHKWNICIVTWAKTLNIRFSELSVKIILINYMQDVCVRWQLGVTDCWGPLFFSQQHVSWCLPLLNQRPSKICGSVYTMTSLPFSHSMPIEIMVYSSFCIGQ